MVLPHQSFVFCPSLVGCPAEGPRPVRRTTRKPASRGACKPTFNSVVPVSDMQRKIPDAVSVRVGLPGRLLLGNASQRTQHRRTTVPRFRAGRRMEMSEGFFDSSVTHDRLPLNLVTSFGCRLSHPFPLSGDARSIPPRRWPPSGPFAQYPWGEEPQDMPGRNRGQPYGYLSSSCPETPKRKQGNK